MAETDKERNAIGSDSEKPGAASEPRKSDDRVRPTGDPPAAKADSQKGESATGGNAPAKSKDMVAAGARPTEQDLSPSSAPGFSPEPVLGSAPPRSAPPPPPPPPPRGGGGGWAYGVILLLAGVLGGLAANPWIAPRVPATLARYLAPRAESGASSEALRKAVQALEGKIAEQEARLAALAQAAEARENAPDALGLMLTDMVQELQTQIRTLETRLAQTRDRTEESRTNMRALDGFDRRLEDLGKRLESLAAGVNQRLNALDEFLPETLDLRIRELEGRLEALRQDLAARVARAEEERATRVSAVDEFALNALRTRAQALEEEIAAIPERFVALSAASRARMLPLAFAALENATHSAHPFARALDIVAALSAAAPPPLLTQFARSGVPDRAALLRALEAQAPVALRAESAEGAMDGNEPFGTRVASWLRGRVSVRRIGESEGDSPEAIVTRAQEALAVGDYGRALGEIESLPAPVLAAFGDVTTHLRMRQSLQVALAGYEATLFGAKAE